MADCVEEDLSNLTINDDRFVDITNEFYNITSQIQFGDIIKSRQFKLLEGTHALEISNPKLDSSLLELTEFDLDSLCSLDEVNWVMRRLLECLCSWLDNNSLSVSVLSCAYVEKLLVNYKICGKGCFSGTKSVSEVVESGENVVVDGVLRAFVVGLVQFVKHVLKMGFTGVIYEEEDLNTQTMDLDFLTKVSIEETVEDLERAKEWLRRREESTAQSVSLSMLQLIKLCLKTPAVLDTNFELYKPSSSVDDGYIDGALSTLDQLGSESVKNYLSGLPPIPDCFSVNIQKTQNNRTPPKKLAQISYNDAISNLTKMFTDLKSLYNMLKVSDALEMYEFLNLFMNKRQFTTDADEILGNHVVVRALMQLFLIRDDRSILGSSKYFISDLMLDLFCKISLQNSKVLGLDNIDDPEKINLNFQKLLGQMESPFYNFLTSISQNPSRQRQFVNKELILWDTLQVESENFEITINDKLRDNFTDSEMPVMPISSFIYYFKLVKMTELLFRSIELDLYKDCREMYIGYWSLSSVMGYLIRHMERLIDINKLRQNQIANYGKKIKKARGDKKTKLKLEYELKKQHLPQLIRSEAFLQLMLLKLQAYKHIVVLRVTIFQMLAYWGYLKLPKHCKVSEELLFNLQLKSFQSIGIPQLPSFQDYQESLASFIDAFSGLEKSHSLHHFKMLAKSKGDETAASFKLMETLVRDILQYPEFLAKSVDEEIQSLRKSMTATQLTLSQLVKAGEAGETGSLRVTFEKVDHHLYFPNIKIRG